jgi:dihydroflavonol-4-reductase
MQFVQIIIRFCNAIFKFLGNLYTSKTDYLRIFAAMILVTGASGLVGSHLVLHLVEQGLKVSAIYRSQSAMDKTNAIFNMYGKRHLFDQIIWIPADVNDIPALEIAFDNIEYVYHCAAKISFDPRDEEKLRKINIEGTANIVNFCLARKVQKLCFVSSIAALGDLPELNTNLQNNLPLSKIIDEETDWNPEKPHSDYAISKYGAEMELWRGQQEGLKVVIVNPGVILGAMPRSWNRNEGSFKLISTVANGLKYYTHGTTGFVSVHDVIKCMTQLMNGENCGSRYILVSQNASYKEITAVIAKALKVKPPKKEAKRWMTKLAWRWDWITTNLFFQKRHLTRAIAKSLHTKDFYSSKKVEQELEFTFEPIEKVIAEIAENY